MQKVIAMLLPYQQKRLVRLIFGWKTCFSTSASKVIFKDTKPLITAFRSQRPIFGDQEFGEIINLFIVNVWFIVCSTAISKTTYSMPVGSRTIRPKTLRPRKLSYSKRIAAIFSGYYLKRFAYLLYGWVASLPSPSSNIEAWPYFTSLRFASLLHLGH